MEKALEGRNAQESTAAPAGKPAGIKQRELCRGNEASKRVIRVVEHELAARGPVVTGRRASHGRLSERWSIAVGGDRQGPQR